MPRWLKDLRCLVGWHFPKWNRQTYYDYTADSITVIEFEGCENCGGLNLSTMVIE